MSYYFQAESNIYYLYRNKASNSHTVINIFRVLMLVFTFYTGIREMALAWNMADIGVGLMAWFNIVAILILQTIALKVFDDYEKQTKAGIAVPRFHPDSLGIKNVTEWKE